MVRLAHSLVLPFLRTGMRIDLFKSCGHCWVFQNLMAESKEELKSLLKRVKEESERASLKLNIKKRLRSWHPASLLHGKQKGKR